MDGQLESMRTRLAGLNESLSYYVAQLEADLEDRLTWPDHVTKQALLLSQADSLLSSILGAAPSAPIHTEPPSAESLQVNPLLHRQVHPVKAIEPEKEHVAGMLLSTRQDASVSERIQHRLAGMRTGTGLYPVLAEFERRHEQDDMDKAVVQEGLELWQEQTVKHDAFCSRALDVAMEQSGMYDWAVRLEDEDEGRALPRDPRSLAGYLRFINRGVPL